MFTWLWRKQHSYLLLASLILLCCKYWPSKYKKSDKGSLKVCSIISNNRLIHSWKLLAGRNLSTPLIMWFWQSAPCTGCREKRRAPHTLHLLQNPIIVNKLFHRKKNLIFWSVDEITNRLLFYNKYSVCSQTSGGLGLVPLASMWHMALKFPLAHFAMAALQHCITRAKHFPFGFKNTPTPWANVSNSAGPLEMMSHFAWENISFYPDI